MARRWTSLRIDVRGQLAAIALAAALAGPAVSQDTPAAADQDNRVMVVVRATWPGQDVEQTTFYVYADAAMKDRRHVFPADAGRGTAVMLLGPGEYYVMAIVDVNANKKADAGDGFGFYGVHSVSAEARPQPLRVTEGQPQTATIDIVMAMDAEGRLAPVARPTEEPGGVIGVVTGQGELTPFVLLLPAGADRQPLAAMAREDGSFEIEAAPGEYSLCAFADANGDGLIDGSDLRSRHWLAMAGEAPVKVEAGEQTDLGRIKLALLEGAVEQVPALLSGLVTGAHLRTSTRARVSLYSDRALKSLVGTTPVGADGRFCVALAPGTYYAKVTVDLEGDGALTVGDMLGFFGVADIMSGERPQPLALSSNALRADLVIPLTARLDDQGRLVAIKAADDAPENAE